MIISRFLTVLCDKDVALDIHYQIRYSVFCEQTGFEDSNAFPSGREIDAYDRFATHFILWDRFQKQWVGAMRLIDAKSTRLPSEAVSQSPLLDLDLYRDRAAEFSRLSIISDHCCPANAADSGLHDHCLFETTESLPISFSEDRNEAFLRLLWASFEWGAQYGIEYCYFIVTAPLARMLKKFGIPLTIVGTEVRHRGVRRPLRYNVYEAKEGMIATLPNFANLAQNTLAFVPFSELKTQSRIGVCSKATNISRRRNHAMSGTS